ncbi:MAG: hypothetical protein ACYTGL_10405 [Planctomycetota bacterium]|jgi:putative heme-binding domain-containing protein
MNQRAENVMVLHVWPRVLTVCFAVLLSIGSNANAADNTAAATSEDVVAAMEAVQTEPTREHVAALIAIDEDIAGNDDVDSQRLQVKTLQVLALSKQPVALDYVRAVFESKTERRDKAAHALSLYCLKRPSNPQDWRYLVRSLPLVEGEQSRSVLQALARFRNRATKAKWLRQAILAGLPLDADGQSAAVELLTRWSGRSATDDGTPLKTLADWQAWFSETYSNQPPPELPQESANARWKFAELSKRLASEQPTAERLKHGKTVYEKATCAKCHRKDDFGERWGPDLTSAGWRLQKKEQLEATMFPSHRLNEEYPTFTVITNGGRVLNGMMMPAGPDEIRVVASDGKQTLLPKTEIDEAIESNRSSMPDGLLEPLTYEQIRDLFLYLDHLGPNANTTPETLH